MSCCCVGNERMTLLGGKYLEFSLPRPRGVNGQKLLMSFRPSLIKTPPIVDISHKNAIPAWQSHLRSDIKLTISPGMAVADFYINKELYPPSQRKIFTYEFLYQKKWGEGKVNLGIFFVPSRLLAGRQQAWPGPDYQLQQHLTFWKMNFFQFGIKDFSQNKLEYSRDMTGLTLPPLPS